MGNRNVLTLGTGMTGMTDNVFINMRNRSFSIAADVDIPQGGANGVILTQGYNFLGLLQYKVSCPRALGPSKATIRVDFA